MRELESGILFVLGYEFKSVSMLIKIDSTSMYG